MKLFNKNTKAGFTLVELIVVIAILGILAGVAIPVYSGYIKKANKAADMQLLGAVNTAFGAACLENNVNSKALADNSVSLSIDGNKCITGVSVTGTIPSMLAAQTGNGVVFSTLGASGGGVQPANLAATSGDINTSFLKYFAGNTGTALKYFDSSDDIAFRGGVFVPADDSTDAVLSTDTVEMKSGTLTVTTREKTTTYSLEREDGSVVEYTVNNDDVELAKQSNFIKNMTSDELVGTVGTAVDAAADIVKNPALMESLLNSIMGADYASEMLGISEDDENYSQELSNALVVAAANGVQNLVSNEGLDNLLTNMSDPNTIATFSNLTDAQLKQMVLSDGGLGRVSIMYALMAGYANSESGQNVEVAVDGGKTVSLKEYFETASSDLQNANGGTNGVRQIVNMTQTMMATTGFSDYINSEATTDFTGIVGAMSVISDNGYEMLGNGGALQNGYTGNDEMVELLSAIFGN